MRNVRLVGRLFGVRVGRGVWLFHAFDVRYINPSREGGRTSRRLDRLRFSEYDSIHQGHEEEEWRSSTRWILCCWRFF